MKSIRLIISAVVLMVILAAGFGLYKLFTQKPAIPDMQMPPAMVTVAKPELMDIEEYYDFTGTTVAYEEVEIRARVQGYLEKIHFVEGSLVKKGDLLFEIERPVYQAMYDQALANLQSREAELKRAQLDLERVEKAVVTNAVSQQEVSTRRAQRDQGLAAVSGAKAALQQAELDLSYTRIYSPIDGRVSRKLVDVGNLVGAGVQTLLATVVRNKPIYVNFHVSEGFLADKLGIDTLDGSSTRKILVARENGKEFPYEGVLNYMDNTIDPGTGTILLRGRLENAEEDFLPGMFVRVRVPIETQKDTVCVYDRALYTDIGGKYLLLVGKNNIVERRPVEIGRTEGQMRVITSGLTAEDTYIIKGNQMLVRPGAPVNPVPEGQEPQIPTQGEQGNKQAEQGRE